MESTILYGFVFGAELNKCCIFKNASTIELDLSILVIKSQYAAEGNSDESRGGSGGSLDLPPCPSFLNIL